MWIFLVFIASILLALSACAPVRSEIPSVAQSQEPAPPGRVVLIEEQGVYPLGLHMEILEDPSAELTIENVSSPDFDERFTPSQAQNPVYGFTDSVYWVRLELDNEASRPTNGVIMVNFPNMHY
jgi:hypothetical protein